MLLADLSDKTILQSCNELYEGEGELDETRGTRKDDEEVGNGNIRRTTPTSTFPRQPAL